MSATIYTASNWFGDDTELIAVATSETEIVDAVLEWYAAQRFKPHGKDRLIVQLWAGALQSTVVLETEWVHLPFIERRFDIQGASTVTDAWEWQPIMPQE